MNVTGTALDFGQPTGVKPASDKRTAALREATNELVGSTFYGEMLKIARNSPVKTELFHGGRGEEMFRAQLDAEFARRAGGATNTSLTDAIVKRLERGGTSNG